MKIIYTKCESNVEPMEILDGPYIVGVIYSGKFDVAGTISHDMETFKFSGVFFSGLSSWEDFKATINGDPVDDEELEWLCDTIADDLVMELPNGGEMIRVKGYRGGIH